MEAFGQEDIVFRILADARKYETRVEEKIAGYSKALEKDSLNFQLYFERGFAFYHLWNANGRTNSETEKSAFRDFDKALSLNPVHHPSYYYRALLFDNAGRKDLAIKELSRAISIDLRNPDYYHRRGTLYLDVQEYNLAKTDLDIALKELYNDFERHIRKEAFSALYRDLAFSSAKLKDYKRAFKDIKAAIELMPHELYNYLYKGNIYAEKGDYKKALSVYNEILQKDPGYLVAYLQRGKIFYAIGEREKAAADWQKMIDGGLKIDIGKEDIRPGF